MQNKDASRPSSISTGPDNSCLCLSGSPLPQHRGLTLAARSPISWQRTNHWLFSRCSTTSPERLQGWQGEAPGAGDKISQEPGGLSLVYNPDT